MGFTVSAKSSPNVVVQFNLPSSTSIATSVAVMALLQEPRMKSIIERDALCGPSLSNPGGTLGDDALAPQNGGGHAETFASPAEYRLQDGINIDRRTVLRLPVG